MQAVQQSHGSFLAAVAAIGLAISPLLGHVAGHPEIDPHAGWVALFDDSDLIQWEPRPNRPDSWVIENGVIARKRGAYLWSMGKHGDFINKPMKYLGLVKGHIPLQDHGSPVWYRKILFLKPLD